MHRLHRHLKPELAKCDEIDLGQAVRAVQLTVTQLRHCIESFLRGWIRGCTDGKCDQRLIGVKTRIAAAKIHGLELLNRLKCGRGDERKLMVDAGQLF